jgi:hypothetical protein
MLQRKWPNPVHEENGQWYFYDETWADRHGPYDSEAYANLQLRLYGEYLNDNNKTGWRICECKTELVREDRPDRAYAINTEGFVHYCP